MTRCTLTLLITFLTVQHCAASQNRGSEIISDIKKITAGLPENGSLHTPHILPETGPAYANCTLSCFKKGLASLPVTTTKGLVRRLSIFMNTRRVESFPVEGDQCTCTSFPKHSPRGFMDQLHGFIQYLNTLPEDVLRK